MDKVNIKLGRPEIMATKYGGVLEIGLGDKYSEPQCIMGIRQLEELDTGDGKIHGRYRKGAVYGTMEQMLYTEYEPGEKTGGKIVKIESYDPPDPHNPEAFIKRDYTGRIVRVCGRVVYAVEQYSYDATVHDEIIDPE